MDNFTLFFDGSCGPINPGGVAAYGFVIRRGGQEEPVIAQAGVIGSGPGMTNNLAEFAALSEALEYFHDNILHGALAVHLAVYGDSRLVINFMTGYWKPSDGEKPFTPYMLAAKEAVRILRLQRVIVSFDWIPREQNTECDILSKAHQKVINVKGKETEDELCRSNVSNFHWWQDYKTLLEEGLPVDVKDRDAGPEHKGR
jgi:ribonuclease HI